ncbi:MAG: hypothetical protein AAF696_09625 [Bacteroidota bacterium]
MHKRMVVFVEDALNKVQKKISDALWGLLISLVLATSKLDRGKMNDEFWLEARQEVRHRDAGHPDLIYKPLLITNPLPNSRQAFPVDSRHFPSGSERIIALN